MCGSGSGVWTVHDGDGATVVPHAVPVGPRGVESCGDSSQDVVRSCPHEVVDVEVNGA